MMSPISDVEEVQGVQQVVVRKELQIVVVQKVLQGLVVVALLQVVLTVVVSLSAQYN